MNFSIKENFKKKALGYYIGLIACAISFVSFIIFLVYASKNNSTSISCIIFLIVGMAVQLAMFFLDGLACDLMAIVIPVCYMVGLTEELHTGVGNIVDAMQGIVMFGKSELAVFNYLLAVLLLIATILAIAQVFMKKNKEDNLTDSI